MVGKVTTEEQRRFHPALSGLYWRIEAMDFHKTHGKHGSEETEAMLAAVWKDSDFRNLTGLLGRSAVLGQFGYIGATRLDVGPSGFYTICDGYGDGNPDGIEVERNIRKISIGYEPGKVKEALLDFVRNAL